MDFSLLEQNIRSATTKVVELCQNEKQRLSLLTAARELVSALELPDEAISNVAVLHVRIIIVPEHNCCDSHTYTMRRAASSCVFG